MLPAVDDEVLVVPSSRTASRFVKSVLLALVTLTVRYELTAEKVVEIVPPPPVVASASRDRYGPFHFACSDVGMVDVVPSAFKLTARLPAPELTEVVSWPVVDG